MARVTPGAPVAPRRPHAHRMHGVVREDPYAWLRDKDDPAVREYLEQENAYAAAHMQPTESLQSQLVAEMTSRINEDDETVPVRDGNYLYYARIEKGLEYWKYCRRPLDSSQSDESKAGAEQIYLDENLLARGREYFDLGDADIDQAHRRVAYSIDDSGDERYTIVVRDLETKDEQTVVEGVAGQVLWARDADSLFYLRLDDTHRPYQVWRRSVGGGTDSLVYEELDEAYFVGIRLTRSERYILIGVHSQVSSEEYVLDAAAPQNKPQCIRKRRPNVEYAVGHQGQRWVILTNDSAPTFRVMEAPLDRPTQWAELRAANPDVTIEDIDAFADYLVLTQRRDARVELVVERLDNGATHIIEQPDPVYAAGVGNNPSYSTDVLRLGYASLGVPASVIDYSLASRTRVVRKQTAVSDFDPKSVVTERIWVRADDGEQIPVSMVRRREDVGRATPVWLTGYGAYGFSSDPGFSSTRVSLLKRGVAVAIAHVRGGADKGRLWYEDGKLLRKTNTFSDFIAVAEHLRETGIASQLAVYGGSAGGLLIGAVVNERPELFDVAIGDVPFVDVLNTMLDATLPLTVIEWDEWGNPQDPDVYAYMASYSPYENVRQQRYPAMLLLAGWNDPRVGYWESAKFAAKLRHDANLDAPLLHKTNLDAGHAGPSGRYAAFRDTAYIYAFALDALRG